MRRLLIMTAILLIGCNAGVAQVSTMGTTAMGLPSTPGAIVTSPLNGPSPFSATTQPGAPDTTLAPLPLASDPTTPGTVVTCSTPTGQITPGTPAVPVISPSSTAGVAITMPSISAAPTAVVSATSPGSTATPFLTLSAQPATSSTSDFPGSTIPAAPQPAPPPLPSPSIAATPVPAPSTTATSATAMMPAAALGTIPTPFAITTTGNISPTAPLGSSSNIVCSSVPGGPPTNGAALPLTTPQIPANPPPGSIQQDVAQLGGTSIDPSMAVMPTPNTSACAESMTMYLATPGTMAPANATGAAATPGVSPPGC
jgi:hypothetical protein